MRISESEMVLCPHCNAENPEPPLKNRRELVGTCVRCSLTFALFITHRYTTLRIPCEGENHRWFVSAKKTIDEDEAEAWNDEELMDRTDWAAHDMWVFGCAECDAITIKQTEVGAECPIGSAIPLPGYATSERIQ